MISDPGAKRQPVHPDTPTESAAHDEAVVCTGFVALQDITAAMGPTVVWAGTHTAAAHAAWEEERAGHLERSEACVATLAKGDLLLFDSRALHCGTANLPESEGRRRLFYFSLKRARCATNKSGAGTLRADLRGGRYRIGHLSRARPD
jgi:ectoine hydroxylase-related dioxygenase (phytanoyl-CoA dioxygenase family)